MIKTEQPDMLLVQGDTTTTLAGALAAFYQRIPVGHVEAGLRTGDLAQPFPEEMNRVATARLATLHFAPTETAKANLLAEGVDAQRICVTGNSGIDAVLHVRDALASGLLRGGVWPQLDPSKKLIVVTAHRRESFGDGFAHICEALARLARRQDTQLIYPVHRNPNVMAPVYRQLDGLSNVFLVEPLDYIPFVAASEPKSKPTSSKAAPIAAKKPAPTAKPASKIVPPAKTPAKAAAKAAPTASPAKNKSNSGLVHKAGQVGKPVTPATKKSAPQPGKNR